MQIDTMQKVTVLGISGTVRLTGGPDGVAVLYKRYTKLGGRLLSNAGGERAVLANYMRQQYGLPRGEANATPFTFTGV